MTGENTLYAQSVCPDEINHAEGCVSDLFIKWRGDVFHMGGLGGIPFTGKTGYNAFSSHIPANGNLFVLMAPHVGVSQSAKIGYYSRIGQDIDSTACGAAVGAFKLCSKKSKADLPDLNNPELSADYQMNFIISEINKKIEKILEKKNPNE